MPTLNYHGNPLDFSQEEFTTRLAGLLFSPFDIIKSVFWAQEVGQIKLVRQIDYSSLEACAAFIRDNLDTIEDSVIRKCAQRIEEALSRYVVVSRELRAWEDANVSSYARRKHKRSTVDVGNFEIAPWVMHPEYQGKLKLVAELVSLYLEALVGLVPYVEPTIINSNSEAERNQIKFFKQQISDYRLLLKVGIREFTRVKAAELS